MRLRLWTTSMCSKIARLAGARDGQLAQWGSSSLRVAKELTATALSQHWPDCESDWTTPCWPSSPRHCSEVRWPVSVKDQARRRSALGERHGECPGGQRGTQVVGQRLAAGAGENSALSRAASDPRIVVRLCDHRVRGAGAPGAVSSEDLRTAWRLASSFWCSIRPQHEQ